MNKPLAKSVDTCCGNCGTSIDPNSQFCAGCGQVLWQKCDCGAMALLTQSFCNGCGTNLAEKLAGRIASYQRLFARCEELQSEGKFDDALRLAESACKVPDYRFADIASQATQLCAQLTEDRDRWAAELEKSAKRVERYLAADRLDDIVRILSRIPVGVLTSELKAILNDCQSKTALIQQCKADYKSALDSKEYDKALLCSTQLAELFPEDTKYRERVTQLVDKVIRKATKYRQQWRFPRAVELLQCIPEEHLNSRARKVLLECEEAVFMRQILTKTEFFSPLVSSVIDKLEELTKGDPAIVKLRERQKKQRKVALGLTSAIWAPWMKPYPNFLNVSLTPTRIPNAMPGAKPECIIRGGSQFFVALGLAVQAARCVMPRGELQQEKKSKGVLRLLGAKKIKPSEVGIGIDIGDSSIKAVRLRYSGDPSQPQIENAVLIPLAVNISSLKRIDKEAIEDGLRKLLSEMPMSGERVVVNFAGIDLVSRYLQLPPHETKKLDEFVLQDARANIPINMDLLQTAYHISSRPLDDTISPSAILVAARKQEVEFRRALLENAGLTFDSFLPEPFALWNALQTIHNIDATAIAFDPSAEQEAVHGQNLADMIVDVGLQRTNILISHPHGIWYRTIDWGTRDLGAAIARSLQLTQAESETIRRDPLKAKHFQPPIEAMQSAALAPKRELERSVHVAREAIGDLRLQRAILVGGGAYQPFLSGWLTGQPF
ncbi:MAG: pilus assembly protein PilM [Pirellulaceae bacterium]